VRQNRQTGHFSRRVVEKIKIKMTGLIFHIIGQTLPHDRFVPNLSYEFASWT